MISHVHVYDSVIRAKNNVSAKIQAVPQASLSLSATVLLNISGPKSKQKLLNLQVRRFKQDIFTSRILISENIHY